jgi:hypothetical protein
MISVGKLNLEGGNVVLTVEGQDTWRISLSDVI